MTRCKLIVNKLSGNCHRINDAYIKELESLLHEKYDEIVTVCIDHDNNLLISEETKDCDAIAVCGGDGTLNSAINAVKDSKIDLVYVPCGTLNDTAKSMALAKELGKSDRRIRRVDMGQIGNTQFAYVLASGTFTAIGYKTKIRTKKRFKLMAYMMMVLKEYKIHHIHAKIALNDRVLEDDYTLIMAINSSRCFGFRFNKKFSHNDGKGQLLLIKAPKGEGFWAKVKIFFPFFRVFFMGFKKEKEGKIIKFLDFKQLTLTLDTDTEFTVDGEKLILNGESDLQILRQKLNLVVY